MSLPGKPGRGMRVPDERYHPGDVMGGKYSLVRPLGVGGMGTVWVAHQIVLDVFVAVKLLQLEEDDIDPAAEYRLLEEARTAARLGHAAIVRVLDFGRSELGDPYIVLELLDGEDLADLLSRERKLDQLRAVALLLPIADALATAHEHGIVHRDVKPENIFLARGATGLQPKLLDFGIARFLDRPRKLTLEGALLGTPEYASPQQVTGKPVTASADLWSFCVVLYELLTGRCPFRGKGQHALVRAIVEDEPASIVERGVDEPELWAILRQGLAKDPEQRPSSMRALGQALAEWMLRHGVTEDVTGVSLRRTWHMDAPTGEVTAALPLPAPARSRPGRPWLMVLVLAGAFGLVLLAALFGAGLIAP